MKLLGLPQYFYPEQAASAYLGKNKYEALQKEGIETVVFVPTPTRGIDAETRRTYLTRFKAKEYMYGGTVEINRFPMYAEGKNSLLRALRYTLVCIVQFNKALFCTKNIDAMVVPSTPPIQGAMGALIKKCKCYPMVYNLQDIFPDSLVNNGLTKKGSILWKIGRVIENFTYRNADKIIVISEDFKRNIMAKGVPEEKIEVIYNWVDENAVVSVPREENDLFDKYGIDRSKFILCYSGNIGLSQNIDMLMDVLKEFQNDVDFDFDSDFDCSKKDVDLSKIHLVLVGDGAYRKQTEEMVGREGLKNVTLMPFQPYEEISKVFSLGDVGLVISKPGTGAASVPSKTWSIMSASRPVLANFDENELKDIVADNECGLFTKAGDKEAFKEAILTLYRDRELCKRMGENGRKFILKNLTREIGTSKYVAVLRSVAGRS